MCIKKDSHGRQGGVIPQQTFLSRANHKITDWLMWSQLENESKVPNLLWLQLISHENDFTEWMIFVHLFSFSSIEHWLDNVSSSWKKIISIQW